MIARMVWDRFRKDWRQFGRMGFWTFTGGGISVLLLAPLVGAWYFGGYLSSRMGHGQRVGTASVSINAAIIVTLLFVAACFVLISLMQAGLMSLVVAYRRGEETGFRTFWAGARRHWPPLLLPAVIWSCLGLANGTSLIEAPFRKLLVQLLIAILALYLGIYPAYLIVADEMGSLTAMGRGLRILVAQPREAMSGTLVLWAVTVAVGLLGDLARAAAPLSLLPWLLFLMFYVPLLPYYFAERFEQNLRPVLT